MIGGVILALYHAIANEDSDTRDLPSDKLATEEQEQCRDAKVARVGSLPWRIQIGGVERKTGQTTADGKLELTAAALEALDATPIQQRLKVLAGQGGELLLELGESSPARIPRDLLSIEKMSLDTPRAGRSGGRSRQ